MERKSILNGRKNIFKDLRQESVKSDSNIVLLECREREIKEEESGWWEKDCLIRAMIGKRGLENTRILAMIFKS